VNLIENAEYEGNSPNRKDKEEVELYYFQHKYFIGESKYSEGR